MMHTPKPMFLFALRTGAGFAPVPGLGEGISSMQALLSDPSVSGRATAALLLEKDKDPQTLAALKEALQDKDWSVRAAAVHALVLRDEPAFETRHRPVAGRQNGSRPAARRRWIFAAGDSQEYTEICAAKNAQASGQEDTTETTTVKSILRRPFHDESSQFPKADFVAGGRPATAVLAASARAQSQPSSVIAETAFGKIRGEEVQGIKIFKGVPYGANTAGQNRFMPPEDPAPWSGVRDALHYGPSTPQSDPGVPRAVSALSTASANLPPESEDCLVLNVWTPALKDGRKRPVLFWCHGGGFVSGSGSSPGTDGANLARRGDVVVVTINHRLNVLGFTYLAEFGGSDFASSGDAGMLDIVHALRWVRNNIEQFGGDPNTVMIFGQSGGGRKVGTLLAMPSAKGLFHRAVIESGPTIQLVETRPGHPRRRDVAREAECSQGPGARSAENAGGSHHERVFRGGQGHGRPGSDDAGLLAHRGWKAVPASSVPSGGVAHFSRCAADAGLNAHGNDAAERRRGILAG